VRLKKLAYSFFEVSRVFLTPADRTTMLEKCNPIGTTIEEVENQLKQEILAEGLAAVRLKLAKEAIFEEELAETLNAKEEQSLTTTTSSFNASNNIKEAVQNAIQHLVNEGLDYATNKPIIVARNSLATRQLAIKNNPQLISYNNDVEEVFYMKN